MKNSAPSGGPEEMAHAADHRHGQDLAGEDDVHPVGRDEVVQIGAEAPARPSAVVESTNAISL